MPNKRQEERNNEDVNDVTRDDEDIQSENALTKNRVSGEEDDENDEKKETKETTNIETFSEEDGEDI
ncbi:MAG: hypothetical protein H0V61_00580 [Chitinophagales bacterium]|nr:hypothetical protein [Chitinophagales bacterium]